MLKVILKHSIYDKCISVIAERILMNFMAPVLIRRDLADMPGIRGQLYDAFKQEIQQELDRELIQLMMESAKRYEIATIETVIEWDG
jgi:hypothetical protein